MNLPMRHSPCQPFLDLAVYLLVQVAHRRCTHARAPQELRDVFHAAHGYPRQVHLDERLLHGRFPAPVALDDGGLERGQAQLGYGQVDLSGGSQKLAVVMTAAVVPALVCPLMPFRVAQLRGFLVSFRLICGYFKSKNWNILFFYPLRGICERKYTLPTAKASFWHSAQLLHICSPPNINKRGAVVNTPAYFCNFFSRRRDRHC